MSVQLNFDASTVKPAEAMEALPAGDYPIAMSEATVVPTSAKDGHYMKCVYTVTEGEYKGRKIFDNLNLWNKSAQATEIAWRQLSAVCHSCGVLQVQDVNQLFGIPLMCKVGVEDSEKYGKSNFVKGFMRAGAAGAVPGGPPAGGFATTPVTPAVAPAVTAPPAAAPPVATPPAAAVPETPAPGATDAPPWAAAPPAATPPAAAPVTDAPPWATPPA